MDLQGSSNQTNDIIITSNVDLLNWKIDWKESKPVITLFQEGNTVNNNKLIFPVALKAIIIKYNKYNFKQYIHIHNKISQSEYTG